MNTVIDVKTPQDQETAPQEVRAGAYCFRYAYARSEESRAAGEYGQDYLSVRYTSRRLAFALCDGVSQSFFGDLAARILGDGLVDWLWAQGGQRMGDPELARLLENRLGEMTAAATGAVENLPMLAEMSGMLRSVLEKKRSLGSESMFICGQIDMDLRNAFFAWMGDSRLRIWNTAGENTARLDEQFSAKERWSSRKGAVGQLHTCNTTLDEISHVVVYSDGFAVLDRALPPDFRESRLDNAAIERLMAYARNRPDSDDLSLFEWWQGQEEPRPFDPRMLEMPAAVEKKQLTGPDPAIIPDDRPRLMDPHRLASLSAHTIPTPGRQDRAEEQKPKPAVSVPPVIVKVSPPARRSLSRTLLIIAVILLIALGAWVVFSLTSGMIGSGRPPAPQPEPGGTSRPAGNSPINAQNAASLLPTPVVVAQKAGLDGVRFSPAGTYVLLLYKRHSADLYLFQPDGQWQLVKDGLTGEVFAVEESGRVATASGTSLSIWQNSPAGWAPAQLPEAGAQICDLRFMGNELVILQADGQVFSAQGPDYQVKRSLLSPKTLLKGSEAGECHLAMAPDSQTIAATVGSSKVLAQRSGAGFPEYQELYSPWMVAAIDAPRNSLVFISGNLAMITSLADGSELALLAGQYSAAAVNPQTGLVLAISQNASEETALFCNLSDCRMWNRLPAFPVQAVTRLSFSPDGLFLLVVRPNGGLVQLSAPLAPQGGL